MSIFEIFSRSQKKEQQLASSQSNKALLPVGWYKVDPAKKLLQSDQRQYLLRKIRRELSINQAIWDHCYYKLFENWAQFVQLIPASETHHHSYPGGLLDHTLECSLNALRLRRGYILPANDAVESISLKADRYTYGVCVASLLHDCGKPLLDLAVVYGSQESHKNWVPWTGCLPDNSLYAFRYRSDRKHGQHEIAGSSLLPIIVPNIGLSWLYEDKELIVYLLAQLTGKEAQAGAIGEIVRAADKESVSKAIKGNTALQYKEPETQKTSLSIHEQLLMAIRYLFNEGVLQLNRPGAAGWIADGRAWLVSKSVVEAAISHLSSEGVTSIPKNIARVFDILLEHGLVMPSEEGKSVWKCKIYDQDRDWHQELTMLCFDQDVVFPNEKPDKFHGTVTPVLKSNEKSDILDDKEAVLKKLVGEPTPDPSSNNSTDTKDQGEEKPAKPPAKSKPQKKNQGSTPDAKNAVAQRFIDWVVNGVESKKIIVNDKDALVHAVAGKVLLVSPAIFRKFLKEKPAAIISMASSTSGKNDVQKLQHHFQRLGLHEKKSGINMREFEVAGDRKKSHTLRGYLVKDKKLIFKAIDFTDNPHIRLRD